MIRASRPVVIVDPREQHAYTFPSGRVTTERGTLPAGDYSVRGLESTVAIERKSLADFANTVVGDRDRWKRELVRLQGYPVAVVIVEACVHDLLAPVETRQFQGGALASSLLSAFVAIVTDYRIPVVWAGDRATAERVTEAMLLRVALAQQPFRLEPQ